MFSQLVQAPIYDLFNFLEYVYLQKYIKCSHCFIDHVCWGYNNKLVCWVTRYNPKA